MILSSMHLLAVSWDGSVFPGPWASPSSSPARFAMTTCNAFLRKPIIPKYRSLCRRKAGRRRSLQFRRLRPWAAPRPERLSEPADRIEIRAVKLVYGLEIGEVGQENGRLDDVSEIQSLCPKHGCDVFHYPSRLCINVAGNDFASSGSSGIWPEQKTKLPTRMACEYGPTAAGASEVEMIFFMGHVSGSLCYVERPVVPWPSMAKTAGSGNESLKVTR